MTQLSNRKSNLEPGLQIVYAGWIEQAEDHEAGPVQVHITNSIRLR